MYRLAERRADGSSVPFGTPAFCRLCDAARMARLYAAGNLNPAITGYVVNTEDGAVFAAPTRRDAA